MKSALGSALPRATRHWVASALTITSSILRWEPSRSLAARLCDAARDGQVFISQRVAASVDQTASIEEIGELALKGLTRPGIVYQVVGLNPPR
jgi:hypothetical protein